MDHSAEVPTRLAAVDRISFLEAKRCLEVEALGRVRSDIVSPGCGECSPYSADDVAVAIPTFGRDEVLVDTIRQCQALNPPPSEILIVDQTPAHDLKTENTLSAMDREQSVCWKRLPKPSIPAAMNVALVSTVKPIILFLDDDVLPANGLIDAHVRAHNEYNAWVVAGQIIQPWQRPADVVPATERQSLTADFAFPFHSTKSCWLQNAMAGHMSVRRELAIRVGGFDENFVGAAYRFETEFARRVIRAEGQIRFCPEASIQHLRAARGGTRSHGNHLASASPAHGVGDYYFAMRQGWTTETVAYMMRRTIREVATRFHLRHPWYIPVKLFGELRAIIWAFQLERQGPALLEVPSQSSTKS